MSARHHPSTSSSSSALCETSDSYAHSTSETSFEFSPEPMKLRKHKHKSESHLQPSKLGKWKCRPSDEEEEQVEAKQHVKAKSSKHPRSGAMTPRNQCLNFAQWIPRGIDMFCILKDVFRITPLIEDACAQSDDDSDVDDAHITLLANILKDTQDQILRTYKKTITSAPYLQELMKGDHKKSNELQGILDDMQYLIGQVRSEDAAHLKRSITRYATFDSKGLEPSIFPKSKELHAKMGLNHPQLAGAAGVAGEAFDLTNVQDGLFEGFLVERVMKHVLTGPSSALAGDNFHVSNSCNAIIHGMMMVEAENIAYAAVQARSAITSHDKWTTEDNKAWATAILQHYNLKLFKDKAGCAAALSTSATSDARDLDEDEDDGALMRKQFALRSANLASTVKPAPPLPAPSSSIGSEALPPRLRTHKDPSPPASPSPAPHSPSPTPHSSSPAPPTLKPHPKVWQVEATAPPAPKPCPKARQVVATTSRSHSTIRGIHTTSPQKQKLTQPESPLMESEAEEVETALQRSPRKAQPKASGKTAKSTSAAKKGRGRK
ncbi:hypothetical protein DFH29DRAFT_879255 [Suillus ampliporus]|nr:hypothetical protein DFH29DRAFT_879255 [Suillus ampliporus]